MVENNNTHIFYSWQHLVNGKVPLRELVLSSTTTSTWRYVRYLIEMKYFAKSLDYIVCVNVPELRDETVLPNKTSLILKRCPGKSLQREIYMPPEVRNQFDASMTEEEKLAEILRGSFVAHQHQQHHPKQYHPSVAVQFETKIIAVPASYICNFCLDRGMHHIRQCPRREKGLPSRKLPTGFPATLLREAVTDEERERAYLTTTGKYVVHRL